MASKYSDIDFDGTFWTVKTGDFYVSTVGSDVNGDGSPQNPFLTVKKAFESAVNGEKIIIGPDQYVVSGEERESPVGAMLPCRVATTGNITLGAPQELDGVQTNLGDRVLVWQQADPVENGIYLVRTSSWIRAGDLNGAGDQVNGSLLNVTDGNSHGGSMFELSAGNPVVPGLSVINFDKLPGAVWGSITGDVANQSDLTVLIDNQIDTLKGGVPTTGDTLNKLYNLIQGVVGVSAQASDIGARDLLIAGLEDQQNVYVADASG
ncbi:MAG: hypothetical protein AAFO69_20730, partial [Bacteroidota bacterium]